MAYSINCLTCQRLLSYRCNKSVMNTLWPLKNPIWSNLSFNVIWLHTDRNSITSQDWSWNSRNYGEAYLCAFMNLRAWMKLINRPDNICNASTHAQFPSLKIRNEYQRKTITSLKGCLFFYLYVHSGGWINHESIGHGCTVKYWLIFNERILRLTRQAQGRLT